MKYIFQCIFKYQCKFYARILYLLFLIPGDKNQMVMKMKSKDKSKLGKIIGYGTSATIHEWKTGQIIKLFWPGTPEEVISRERNLTSEAYSMGIPCPKVIETVGIGKRKKRRIGIVFEKIADGRSMLEDMFTKHDEVELMAKEMANLHATMHIKDVDGVNIPDEKALLLNGLQEYAEHIKGLREDKKHTIIKILELLPQKKIMS